VLFTPRSVDGLPGLRFPAAGPTFPGKQEVVSYLERYTAHFSLPVRYATRITALRREDDAFAAVSAAGDTFSARQVVVATGPYQKPRVPRFAADLPSDIVQLHSSEYRNPSQLPAGDILVVGGANSGAQIAEDLLRTHRVALSSGRRLRTPPAWLRATRLFWGLLGLGERVGASLRRRTPRGPVGRAAFVVPSLGSLAARGVDVVGRAIAADSAGLALDDGRRVRPACVIWATGYVQDHGWIEGAPLDDDGLPRHYDGVTRVPGLYFLGMTGVASLLPHIGRAARVLAERMRR